MIQPTNEWILVKMIDKEQKTASGLYLAGTNENVNYGIVVNIDPCIENPIIPKEAKIVYPRGIGSEIVDDEDGEHYLLMKANNILAFIDPPEEKEGWHKEEGTKPWNEDEEK